MVCSVCQWLLLDVIGIHWFPDVPRHCFPSDAHCRKHRGPNCTIQILWSFAAGHCGLLNCTCVTSIPARICTTASIMCWVTLSNQLTSTKLETGNAEIPCVDIYRWSPDIFLGMSDYRNKKVERAWKCVKSVGAVREQTLGPPPHPCIFRTSFFCMCVRQTHLDTSGTLACWQLWSAQQFQRSKATLRPLCWWHVRLKAETYSKAQWQ